MNFTDRILASGFGDGWGDPTQDSQEVEALTRDQFNAWDHGRQEQYLRDHPDSDFLDQEESPKGPAAEPEGGDLPADPAGEEPTPSDAMTTPSDTEYPVPAAPTTFMVLNNALGPLDKKYADIIRNCVDQVLDQEAVGVAETNLRSLTRAQLQYVTQLLGQGQGAAPELQPETQQVLNTLYSALTQQPQS